MIKKLPRPKLNCQSAVGCKGKPHLAEIAYEPELARVTFQKDMERNSGAQAVQLGDKHFVTHPEMSRASR